MEQLINRISNLSKGITRLGISLIFTFLIIDLLFPGSTGMTTNVATVAGSISQEGLSGLIALGLFYVIYTRGENEPARGSSQPPTHHA